MAAKLGIRRIVQRDVWSSSIPPYTTMLSLQGAVRWQFSSHQPEVVVWATSGPSATLRLVLAVLNSVAASGQSTPWLRRGHQTDPVPMRVGFSGVGFPGEGTIRPDRLSHFRVVPAQILSDVPQYRATCRRVAYFPPVESQTHCPHPASRAYLPRWQEHYRNHSGPGSPHRAGPPVPTNSPCWTRRWPMKVSS
jgi:hypothetical protein